MEQAPFPTPPATPPAPAVPLKPQPPAQAPPLEPRFEITEAGLEYLRSRGAGYE